MTIDCCLEDVNSICRENDGSDNDSFEHDELDWRREVADHANNPNLVRFYDDGGIHGNHEAEFPFRQAFAKAAVESLLAIKSADVEQIFDELYELERSAKQARKEARDAAQVGTHHVAYRVGHEIEASRTRGRCHGLISGMRLFETLEAQVKEGREDRELSDAEFDAERSRLFDLIRSHVPGFTAWVERVRIWAASNCDGLEPMSYYFETIDLKLADEKVATVAAKNNESDIRIHEYECLQPPTVAATASTDDAQRNLALRATAQQILRNIGTGTPVRDTLAYAQAKLQQVGDSFEQPPKLLIRKAGELIRDFPSLPQPVLEGLLRRGETLNIIAAPKVGKSWLSMGLALTVATGGKWLGRFWATRGRVLIVDNELSAGVASNRLPLIARAMDISIDEYTDRLSIANLRGSLIDMDRLAAELSSLPHGEFDLIVLDAWYRFQPTGSDENSNGDVARLYNLLDSVAHKIGCAFACVHHTSKGNQAGKGVTDVGAGAGAQARAADSHLALRQHEQDGAVVVDAAVRSWAPMEPFCLRWKFPVWELADDLDPQALKQERPRTSKKQADESGLTTEDKKRMARNDVNTLKVLEYLESIPDGDTKSQIGGMAGINEKTYRPIHFTLLRSNFIVACMVQKSRKSPFQGFKITQDGLSELRRLRLVRQNDIASESSDCDVVCTPTVAPPLGGNRSRSTTATSGGTLFDGAEIRPLSDQELDRADSLFGSQSA